MTENGNANDARTFVLRLWSVPEGEHRAWRFSLEDPRTRGRRGFDSLREIRDFLAGLCRAPRPSRSGGGTEGGPLTRGRRAAAVLALSLLALAPLPGLALDAPPPCGDALWWGTWAVARMSPKTINDGDTVTITLSIVGGPPEGTYCNTGRWTKTGTGAVDIRIPGSCFDLVDYTPKADALRDVTVDAAGVHWRAKNSGPAPSTEMGPQCYCRWDGNGTSSDTRGCATDFWKGGQFGPGDTLTVTLRAKCARVDSYWSKSELAWLSGHWGLNWAYGAEDYFKFGGHMAVSLTADPSSVPADGTASSLSATVTESASGVLMPRADVAFAASLGILGAASSVTDANGVAGTSISSPGVEGTSTVTARVPGAQGQAPVTFTHVDNPPSPWDNGLGPYQQVAMVGDPVHAGIGNYVFSRRLFGFPGKGLPFDFEVVHNSRDSLATGPLGFGWTHSYNVVLTPSGSDVSIRWGDGRVDRFHGDGAGSFAQKDSRTRVKVTMPDAGHYLATSPDGVAWQFDAAGKLLSIVDPNGNRIVVTWSTTSPGLIDGLTDTAGRQVSFTHDAAGRITSIASPLKPGNTVAFQYDPGGNLSGIVDPRGKTWSFTYDGAHKVATVIDAKGTTTLTNTYDASGRISRQVDGGGNLTTYDYVAGPAGTTTKVTPPSGNAVFHEYDPALNVVKMTDGEGRSARFQPDALGRFVGTADKAGAVSQTVSDANGNPALSRDRSGGVSRFAFDASNRPASVSDPLGHTTSFGRDASGNVTRLQNPLGDAMGFSYDASGLPTSLSDFIGATWGVAWDASGLPQTVTEPTGAQTGFSHDAAGRLTQVQRPAPGGTTRLTYDDAGHVLTRTDALGHVTTFAYDENGNLVSRTFVPTGATTTYGRDWVGRATRVTDALGGVSTAAFGPDGNVTSTTDPDGVTMTYEYDRSNRLTALVDALGHRVRFGHDANGRVATLTDGLGNAFTTDYDASGRPVRLTDPLGGSRSMVYDAAGRLTSVSNEVGSTVTSHLDAAGRLASTTLPDQGVIAFTRDRNGRPLAVTDPMGNAWTFSWDPRGFLLAATDPSGRSERGSYDALGRITTRTLRDGATIAYSWDAGDRLTSVTAAGTAVTYGHDAAGNVVSMTDPSGTTTITRDLLGRRLSQTYPTGKTMAFSYTPAGRPRTITYPGGFVVTRAYDTAGRLASLTDSRGNVTTFQYDAANRLTRVSLPNGTSTLLAYDAAGRVTSRESRTSSGTVLAAYSYSYDGTGRTTSVRRTEPAVPALSDSSATFTYDSVNRVLTATADGVATTYSFDARGNLTSRASAAGTATFSWDPLGRLVSATDGSGTTTYTYDGAGNRLGRASPDGTTRWLRDGRAVYAALDGGGNVVATHVWAGSLLYSLDASGAIRVYHGDERGSVVAITDAVQNVVQSYSYDPYGKVVGASGSLDNPFRFVGTHGVMAERNGLYHMNARTYDADARRFISEDPLGLSAGLNLYAYAEGNPVSRIDPKGTKSTTPLLTLPETLDVNTADVPTIDVPPPEDLPQIHANGPPPAPVYGPAVVYEDADWAYRRVFGEDDSLGGMLWSVGTKLGVLAATTGEATTTPFIQNLWTGPDDAVYEAAKSGLQRLGYFAEEKAVEATALESTVAKRGIPTPVKVVVGSFIIMQVCDTPENALKALGTTEKGIGSLIRGTGMFLKAVWDGLPAGAPPPDWKSSCVKSLDCTAYGDGLINKARPPA